MTKEDLRNEDVKTVVVARSKYTLEVINGMIYFEYTLNNDQSTNDYDHVPISLVFDARHKDNYNFIEHITIVQYPAMYIIAVKNESSSNVFIYKNQNKQGAWDDLVDLNSGGNHNPNMYIINVSAFDDNNYIIGDTRSDNYISGKDLDLDNKFNNKALSFYYSTRTDVSNFIAPKFRIASSRGKCSGDMDYNDAKKDVQHIRNMVIPLEDGEFHQRQN